MKSINEKTNIKMIDNMFLFDEDFQFKIELKKTHQYQPIELVTIIHFLLTHLRNKDVFEISTNVNDDDLNSIQKHFYDYYILVCCILFRKDIVIKNSKGHTLYTDDIYDRLIHKLKSQEELYARDLNSNHIKELKGRIFSSSNKSKNEEGLSFLIPCFDHLDQYGLERSYYFYNPIRSKGPRDIAVWFERLFQFNDLDIFLPNFFYNLSTVINELMQNTHDWARTTFDNQNHIKPNIRACALNIFLENKLSFKDSSYDDVQEYIKDIFESKKEDIHSPERQTKFEFTGESIGICEMSILDTGPGMARRWLGRDYPDISKEEEIQAVIKCFHKYFTSDGTSKNQLRGRGLGTVIGIIGSNGLIRVRSGNILIQRNFFRRKVQKTEIQNEKIEFDKLYNDLPLIEGTTISVLYPFVYTPKVASE